MPGKSEIPAEWVVDFPTLGFLAADWIGAHCVVAGGPFIGEPFIVDGWQLWCTVNHYRVKPGAAVSEHGWSGATQFAYRRSLVVGPQKTGKSPWAAGIACFEGVGPCLFGGWAAGGEVYRCSDNGCGCGWWYQYEAGEPLGIHRPKSLIQLLASAETQTANIYEPLQDMIRRGPLVEVAKVREGFIRLPGNGKIEPVSGADRSKLGNPINFAIADESGIYTGRLKNTWQTMRRGLAGMSGRALEITNPWDPLDNSSAQATFNSASGDIFRFYRKPPSGLDYMRKVDRRKIHEFVYAGSPWVDLGAVEAEAVELMAEDPTQARRFFGNQLVQGLGAYMPEALWKKNEAEGFAESGCPVVLGFDGSRSGDWTALRACTVDRWRFTPTYGPDERKTVWIPDEWPQGRIPRGEVDAAVDEMMTKYRVARFYVDPRHWETQADEWARRYGDDVVVQWPTNQVSRMFDALVRYLEDVVEGLTTHDGCGLNSQCAMHARKVAKPGDKYLLGKPAPHLKIDVLMADILAYEAAADMLALGWSAVVEPRMIAFA